MPVPTPTTARPLPAELPPWALPLPHKGPEPPKTALPRELLPLPELRSLSELSRPEGWQSAASDMIGRLRVVGAVAAATLAAVPSTVLAPPLPLTLLLTRRYRREALLTRLHSMVGWARFCTRTVLGIELSVVGREHLPRPSRGHLYISNHQSVVDILVLIAALETVAFLAKAELLFFPVIGPSAYAGGSVLVRRGHRGSRQRALEKTTRMARESTAVVIFPEGTRSPDGRPRDEIHPRAILRAHREGLRIVPVGIEGTAAVAPKRADRLVRGLPVGVTIGAPMDPVAFDEPAQWTAAVWSRVKQLYAESGDRVHRLRSAS